MDEQKSKRFKANVIANGNSLSRPARCLVAVPDKFGRFGTADDVWALERRAKLNRAYR